MGKDDREQIGLRVPKAIQKKLKDKAQKTGVSVNSLILMFIDIGFTATEKGFILREPKE